MLFGHHDFSVRDVSGLALMKWFAGVISVDV
jgi:hypothetical protein